MTCSLAWHNKQHILTRASIYADTRVHSKHPKDSPAQIDGLSTFSERERTKRRGREEPQVPLSQVPRGLGVRFRAQVYKTSSYADYQVLPIECLACKAAKRPQAFEFFPPSLVGAQESNRIQPLLEGLNVVAPCKDNGYPTRTRGIAVKYFDFFMDDG